MTSESKNKTDKSELQKQNSDDINNSDDNSLSVPYEDLSTLERVEDLKNVQFTLSKQYTDLEIKRKELELQQKKLEESSEKFRCRTIELFGKMVDLKKAKKIISQQNEQLEKQQHEITIQQIQLESTNQKFRERTIELFGKMVDLKKAKKTISLQNDELEQQQKKLHELNASKDKFFSIIAHDLRNPIAGFLNLTDILSENFSSFSEKESKEFIDLMNHASKQLYNLLENLLQWSRSQTGSIPYEPKIVTLKPVVENTIDLLMMNIKNKKLKVSIEVNGECKAFADENMITTVIRNLLSNSIKFSNINGLIKIKADCINEQVTVSIIDNGVGMRKEDQEKLFRINKHHTTQGTSNEAGSGLGLILCKEFVERNGGKIWVESDLNKGSTFSFTLPFSKAN
ncbi:MAG: ATP-binding protein [Bacteroidales bacterium]